ncbi:MAG: hypothetical protein ACOCZI_00115 [Marinilabiliaceae bacterium]
MLYRTLHDNSLVAIILVPVIIFLLWIRVFFFDGLQPISFDGVSMPLWDVLVRPVFGQNNILGASLSFLMVLLIALTINRVVGRYGLLGKQSVLPALMYGLLVSGFLPVQRLHVVWIFTFFLLLGIERIMGAAASSRKEGRCFDAGLLTGVGALIYAKGVFFFPVLIVVMGVLRLLTLRTFIASLLGVLLPFILSTGYFFLKGGADEFLLTVVLNQLSNTGQFSHTLGSQVYLPLMVVLTLMGLINLFRYMPVQKIVTRKHLKVIVWIILLTAAATLTPFFSVEITPLVAIGPAVVFAFWLDKMTRRFWRELFLWFLVGVTIAAQFFL